MAWHHFEFVFDPMLQSLPMLPERWPLVVYEKTKDQFEMSVGKNSDGGGGILKMMWEDVQYSVPFTVKK